MSDEKSKSQSTAEQTEMMPAFNLAAFGLQHVDTLPKPVQTLNARGMPARVRKPNPLFFDDDIVNDVPLSVSDSPPRKVPAKKPKPVLSAKPVKLKPKVDKKRKAVENESAELEQVKKAAKLVDFQTPKSTHTTLTKTITAAAVCVDASAAVPKIPVPPNKEIVQCFDTRMRKLLKLQQAYKWIIYEFVYSFLDKSLLQGENEFQKCLAKVLPDLEARNLSIIEWQTVRSMMGKPRRFSSAFLKEERLALESKRQKIRILQTRKFCNDKDANLLCNLPPQIPLPLPVGTKVVVRVRTPQDDLLSGMVSAFDSLKSIYRIAFDGAVGSHFKRDIDIMPLDFFEMKSVQSMKSKTSYLITNNSERDENRDNVTNHVYVRPEKMNGYSVKLLDTVVILKRLIAFKRQQLERLSNLNMEVEAKTNSAQENMGDEYLQHLRLQAVSNDKYKQSYTTIVLSLEKTNRNLGENLTKLQSYTQELAELNPELRAMLAPTLFYEKCRKQAHEAVARTNQGKVRDTRVLGMVNRLATMLTVGLHLGDESNSMQVSRVLDDCFVDIRNNLCVSNLKTFQQNVESKMNHIRLALGQFDHNHDNEQNDGDNEQNDGDNEPQQ